MVMETNSGGGIKKMFGRLFSGESMFINEYTPQGGKGVIAFASSFPGSIIPLEITLGNGIIVQKNSFLAMEKGLELVSSMDGFEAIFVGTDGNVEMTSTETGFQLNR